eukprot:9975128-Alexandrium_andersonii.AAC.1
MREGLVGECFSAGELTSLSIDCTFRLMFSLLGQCSYRASAAVKAPQALPPQDARACRAAAMGGWSRRREVR